MCKMCAVSKVSKSGKSFLVAHGYVQLTGSKRKANFKILMIRAGLKPDIFWLHAQVRRASLRKHPVFAGYRRADFLAMPPFVHNLIRFKEVLQTTSPSYRERVNK